MRASEMKSKLSGDLSALNKSISALEAERRDLALPAHSGDADAMLRVVDLRTDIADKRSSVSDLEQALADVEPAVLVEQATERLRHREELHWHYCASCAELLSKMKVIDDAVLQLARAFHDVAEPLARTRGLAVEAMAPIGSGDITHQVEQRMLIAQRVGIRSVADLIETALEDVSILHRRLAPYPHRPDTKLADAMKRSLSAVEARVNEALQDDRRASVAAGVVLEVEPA